MNIHTFKKFSKSRFSDFLQYWKFYICSAYQNTKKCIYTKLPSVHLLIKRRLWFFFFILILILSKKIISETHFYLCLGGFGYSFPFFFRAFSDLCSACAGKLKIFNRERNIFLSFIGGGKRIFSNISRRQHFNR